MGIAEGRTVGKLDGDFVGLNVGGRVGGMDGDEVALKDGRGVIFSDVG